MKYITYFTDLTHTGAGVNSGGIPLGIGNVAAYAKQQLPEQLSIELFKFPDDFNKALEVKIPHFLCMSNACFNINLSYAFARYVKEKHPNVVIIFGGPNFPTKSHERKEFLKKYSHIDFYIKWDGEVSFVNLIKKLIEYNLDITKFKKDKIITQNCCYLIGGDEYIEGPDHRIHNISEMPSAYTMGLLDKFFGHGLAPTYEITRGCPYACTFCNSGHDFKNLVTRKSLETIREDLEYIAKRSTKDTELWIADDNFGMYKEDILISHVISDIMKKYNWPTILQTTNGKSQPMRILETRDIINQTKDGALRFGASLQSSDPEILKNIRRKNLPLEKLINYTKSRHTNNDINDFFTEFILPLPGETKQKHYDSLRYAIDTLESCNIDIHQLMLLMGTEMNDPDTIEKYKMNIRYRVYVSAFGIYNIGHKKVPCAEIDKCVVGNSTISYEEYIECRIIDLLVKIFIDHDPFREVIGFVRKLNLSVFDLIITLKEKIIPKYNSLTNLVAEFVEKSEKPLYKDLEELEIFLSKEATIRDYTSGKLGGNELLNCKVKAYMKYFDDLHYALKESIIFTLKKHNKLTFENEDYLNQVIKFSRLRKFDINNINETKSDAFTYDFVAAAKVGYKVDPKQVKIKKAVFKFSHDDKTLHYIKERMDFWNKYVQYEQGLGKIYQKTNMEMMSRKVYI